MALLNLPLHENKDGNGGEDSIAADQEEEEKTEAEEGRDEADGADDSGDDDDDSEQEDMFEEPFPFDAKTRYAATDFRAGCH